MLIVFNWIGWTLWAVIIGYPLYRLWKKRSAVKSALQRGVTLGAILLSSLIVPAAGLAGIYAVIRLIHWAWATPLP